MPRIGAHISAAGGLHNAPVNARALGLDVFQFFSRPPQGGPAPKLDERSLKKFRAACDEHGFDTWYIHAPYVINLASAEERIRHASIGFIRTDLERATALKAKAIMTHLGSASAVGEKRGRKLVAESVKAILKNYIGTAQLLLEISAGAGAIIGDTFEEMADILAKVGDERIGICFDTAHAFASGNDLRDAAAVKKTLKEFDANIGLKRLALFHLNDSMTELGSHKDRHDHLGDGKIGAAGLKSLVTNPLFKKMDFILETPGETED
ncbi:MAG: deoxyribonuclease IV, partial [Patescibacteria group bacterium]|nr:deoxyribonuclease IV [Patescibacteria group bacterium]